MQGKIIGLFLVFAFSSFLTFAQNVKIGEIKNLKIDNVKGKRLDISFTTTIKNLTSKGVGVRVIKGEFYKNGELYGRFTMPKKVKLKKKEDKNLEFRLKVVLEKELDLVKEGLKLLSQGGKPEITVKGKFRVSWFIFWKTYPFEFSDKVKL